MASKKPKQQTEALEASPKKPKTAARQIIAPEQDNMVDPEDIGLGAEEEPEQSKSRRGARQLTDKKPKQAARFLYAKEVKSDRPVTIYIERITDVDTGKTGAYIWWHAEDSKTIGRREITRINARTEEEFTLGYDFEIPLTRKIVEQLLRKSFVRTKWCKKDGPNKVKIDDPKKLLDELK